MASRLPVFQWIAKGHEWNLFDSIGQPSIFPISFKNEKQVIRQIIGAHEHEVITAIKY